MTTARVPSGEEELLDRPAPDNGGWRMHQVRLRWGYHITIVRDLAIFT